ncbi:MAG: BMP family ABC transporter substrate-binding protein [Eubacteriales bacterium]|nr:BMP family ABC transporter substrate-binding protein [Eubacteriales bacterium]
MKVTKKLIGLLLVLALALSALTGCAQTSAPVAADTSSDSAASDTAAAEPTEAAEAAEATEAAGIPLSEIKVGVVLNTMKEDGGWSQSHNASFLAAKEQLGLTDDQMIIIDNVPDTGNDCANTIEMLIGEGCNMIFGTSSGLTDAIHAEAKLHPDVYFHQFEGVPADNCASYSVRDWETMFLLGYAGAKLSNGDKLGFMAAQPQASVVRAVNAYALGAKYANPNATVQVVWANSWYDPAKEKEGATSMLASGINVLGYHGSTTAVAEACTDAGAFMSGFHIDMHDYAPTAVYSSHMWNWTPLYVEFINRAVAGTWTGEMLYMGIDSGCAQLAPWNTDIVSADLIAELNGVQAKLESGEIQVFGGPLSDNTGKEVLAAGAEFTNDQLIGMMFLVDNVIGQLPS